LISKLTGVESAYETPDVLWERIVPSLPPPKRRRLVVHGWTTGRIWALFSIFYVPAVNGKHFQEILVLQVQYMTDFRNDGERLVYSSNVCGLIASLYDKNNRIDWKWQSMDGVITKGSLGEKMYRFKSHRQS
jgi:hypothetical protein